MSYLTYLETFLSVFRTGSQTQAANELHLTQPAISQHIKSLENRIGKPLFIRKTKGLEPTPAAHQLALQISQHIDAIHHSWQTVAPFTDTIKTIYLGGTREFIATDIIPNIKNLLDKNKLHIRFILEQDYLVERLLNNEIDIAISVHPISHESIQTAIFYKETFALVGHPSFKNSIKKYSHTELNKLPWIAYNEDLLFITDYYQQRFNKPFNGEIKLVIDDFWSILSAVSSGIGISILPMYICQKLLSENKIIHLDNKKPLPMINYFYLAWKKGALSSPHVASTVSFLRQITKK